MGNSGDRLYFDGIAGDTSIDVSLVSPSAVVVFESLDVSGDHPTLTLSETGIYELIIDGVENTIGDFSFRVLDTITRNLPLDRELSDTLSLNITEVFTFSGAVGQRLLFEGLNDNRNALFTVYDPIINL